MNKSNSNNTGKPVKRPAFHHSKNSRGMKLLYHPSTLIEHGAYAGKTFGYVLKHFGKKAFPELLKYYRISSRIMEEYHCTLKPHVENPQKVESTPVNTSATMSMDDAWVVDTNETEQSEKVTNSTDALVTTERIELDDNKWTRSRSDYENNVLYDPEDDVPDTFRGALLEANGGSYWDNA